MGNEYEAAPADSSWNVQDKNSGASDNDRNSQRSNDAPYARLKEYETNRRLAYSSKYDSVSLYWKSYRDLLKAALQETSRAQRLVLGTCHAHQLYANAMTAMHDDVFLDEKGNVANEKHQKRLYAIRKEKSKKSGNVSKSVLAEIREAQRSVAGKFEENARNMDEEIAEAVGALLEDVKEQFSRMESLGSSVLSELENTESEVATAWSRYQTQNDGVSESVAGTNRSSKPETTPSSSVQDSWIVETQYRVAVAYQNKAWEKGSQQLDELFRKVKQEEIIRRMNLREFLVAFVQRQQRLFLSLPSVHNSVLEQLVGEETTREEIERSVSAMVNKKDGTCMELGSKGNPTLESPLTSDLLSKAKVVERRGGTAGGSHVGSNAEWQVSLAIVTADGYLHFFDLENARFSLSSSPEEVFQVLMPSVVVPTVENLHMAKSNFSKGWSDSLIPIESLILAKCILHNIDATAFAIVEKGGGASAASKMFGKLVDKKIEIRTIGRDDKEEWLSVLTSQS